MCEACSVFAMHNKYIVEVSEINRRSTEFIEHSFKENFMERAMGYVKLVRGSSRTILFTFIPNKMHDNCKTY